MVCVYVCGFIWQHMHMHACVLHIHTHGISLLVGKHFDFAGSAYLLKLHPSNVERLLRQ